eukprot:comp22108_c0_seq1/m.32296 comp22108_c0_seq1/g.32296  ORF comp22108_c0_seq1/g.32296 comp22108_c0_seq1/m.32296 type:complete len:152 (-) comp22108_c0_seq1:326-781(-)
MSAPQFRQSQLPKETATKLVSMALEAKQGSYSPYSKFRVGACLLTEDGLFIKGANIENASYGLCICAERTALVKAASEGHRRFKALAVSSDLNDIITPCGACRQFIVEFGRDYEILMTRADGTFECCHAADLLPWGFFPDHLELDRPGAKN